MNRQNGFAKFFVFVKIFAKNYLFYFTVLLKKKKRTINVTKHFAKPFSLFIWALVESFEQKIS